MESILVIGDWRLEIGWLNASKNLCHKIPASPFPADLNHAAEREVVNGAAVSAIFSARTLAISGG